MARVLPSVVMLDVHDAQVFDEFTHVWVRRRVEAGLSADGARRAVCEGRLAEILQRSHVGVLLAYREGRIAGYAWTSHQPLSAALDSPSLSIDDLFVLHEARGSGIGRALLAASASAAQRQGVEQVSCSVPTQARDTNRALARLGFAATFTRRVAPTNGLLRRLRWQDQPGAVDQVLLQRRRRVLRARTLADGAAAAH